MQSEKIDLGDTPYDDAIDEPNSTLKALLRRVGALTDQKYGKYQQYFSEI